MVALWEIDKSLFTLFSFPFCLNLASGRVSTFDDLAQLGSCGAEKDRASVSCFGLLSVAQ